MKKTILFPSDFPKVLPEVGNQIAVVVIFTQEDQFPSLIRNLVNKLCCVENINSNVQHPLFCDGLAQLDKHKTMPYPSFKLGLPISVRSPHWYTPTLFKSSKF